MPICGTTTRTSVWRAAALLAMLAFGVRLLALYQTSSVPTARHLIGDAAGYYTWARSVAAGNWIGTEAFYQAPLYPYVLAVWFTIVGDSLLMVRVLQAAWGAGACALLCVAATRMFERRVGILAGVLLALYGPAVFFDGIVQKASLDNLLICAMLALATSGGRRLSAGRCVGLGAVVSLLALTRENAIVWHFIWPAWIALGETGWVRPTCENGRRGESRGARPGAVGELRGRAGGIAGYALGAVAILMPVGLRNAYVGGEFSVTTFQAGPNFYIGNHRGADGRYQPLVRGHETPAFERRDATMVAQKATGRTMTPREVSRYWLQQAWLDIKADPRRWLRLMGYKAMLTTNRYEVSDAESCRVYGDASRLLSFLGGVGHFGVVVPLAVLGAAATWPRRRKLWAQYALAISMGGAVTVFYVLARYRYPLVPILMPFAAAGCVHAWDSLRSWRLAALRMPTALAIAAGLVVNWPIQDERRLDALAEMNAGVALAESGELKNATALFRGALEINPQSAEANNNLAQALALQGGFAEAVGYYRAALAMEPNLPGVHYNFGVAFEQMGRTAEAAEQYALAVGQDPGDDEARAAIKRLADRPGQ